MLATSLPPSTVRAAGSMAGPLRNLSIPIRSARRALESPRRQRGRVYRVARTGPSGATSFRKITSAARDRPSKCGGKGAFSGNGNHSRRHTTRTVQYLQWMELSGGWAQRSGGRLERGQRRVEGRLAAMPMLYRRCRSTVAIASASPMRCLGKAMPMASADVAKDKSTKVGRRCQPRELSSVHCQPSLQPSPPPHQGHHCLRRIDVPLAICAIADGPGVSVCTCFQCAIGEGVLYSGPGAQRPAKKAG